MQRSMRSWAYVGGALAFAGIALGAAVAQQAAPSAPNPMDARARIAMAGYLPKGGAPDSTVLVPPPPEPGSAAMARDEAAMRAAVALRGSARWEQATTDALLFTPTVTSVFSCAAGVRIGKDTTPRLDALLRKAGPDISMAVYPTKRQYQRQRPFMINGEPTCTPQDEAVLRRDGSYPSGHSALGYGWGLILAELMPARSAQLVARGRAFGDSRRVCNVHWLSDVEEGRVVATAVVARLHAEPEFQRDMAAARSELSRHRSHSPAPDCARENAALANG